MSTGELKGIFTITTSYRQEPNPVPGRHNLIFPMFEYEAPGTMVDLLKLEGKLLKYLGYSAGKAGRHPDTDESHSGYPELTYDSLCEKHSTHELDHGHEERLLDDYGHAAFITNFPEHTDPFWNMARKDGRAQKVDVILSGIETIGSAERSIDPEQMRKNFLTISKGKYAEKLFAEFGRERVMAEMDQFMALTFVPRFGGGNRSNSPLFEVLECWNHREIDFGQTGINGGKEIMGKVQHTPTLLTHTILTILWES